MTETQPAAPAFPDPASPEGQAWAAAGFPVADGKPIIPGPAAPAGPPPAVGEVALYPVHDPYHPGGAQDREQVVLVTALEDDGAGGVRIRGIALGYADDAASFTPAQLRPAT